MKKKCGYVALMGRPNAGKSTLLNSLVGEKVAVVSAKPQTTRNKIIGLYTENDTQLIFLDTPGMHKAQGLPRLNKAMNKAAWNSIGDADVICYLCDASNGWTDEDTIYFGELFLKSDKPIVLIASKIDSLKKEYIDRKVESIAAAAHEILEKLELEHPGVKSRLVKSEPYRLSAKRPDEVTVFRQFLTDKMPEGDWLFPEDDLTDKPQQFLCGEIIREQLFRQLGQELPYQCAVRVDEFTHEPKHTTIRATLVVQKENHKGMVIGRAGSRLKSIGTDARLALEKHLDRKVFLELFVKVHEGWIDDKALLAEYASMNEEEL